VKPHAFVNIKTKLLEDTSTKARAFSSIIDKKPAIPPVKLYFLCYVGCRERFYPLV